MYVSYLNISEQQHDQYRYLSFAFLWLYDWALLTRSETAGQVKPGGLQALF